MTLPPGALTGTAMEVASADCRRRSNEPNPRPKLHYFERGLPELEQSLATFMLEDRKRKR